MPAAKRKLYDAQVEDAIQSFDIQGDWMSTLLTGDRERLILLIAEIANQRHIDTRSFKKARIDLPSFTSVKWTEFASKSGFPENPKDLQLNLFTTPVYILPPSFHKSIFENSWRALDVHQEKDERTGEASRVRTLDPVCK